MTLQSMLEQLSAGGAAWVPGLLDVAAKGVVVMALTGITALAMRRSSAAGRHLVWFLGICSLLILPLLCAALPAWHILPQSWPGASVGSGATASLQPTAQPLVRTMPPPGERVGVDLRGGEGEPRGLGQPADLRSSEAISASRDYEAQPRSHVSLSWQSWLLLMWTSGTLLLLAHLALGSLSLRWLEYRSARVSDAEWLALLLQLRTQLRIRRPVDLLSSPRRTMPMTWGLWRTRLLLPQDAMTWTPEQRRAVLLHELAHAKRWDCLSQLVVQIACALYWFNPLIWLAWSRIQAERERACDDLVLATGTKPSAYAQQLLHIASEMPPSRLGAAAIAMARPGTLEGRVLAILDTTRNRRMLTGVAICGLLLVTTGIVLPVAALRAAQAAATQPATVTYGPIVPEGKPTSDITGIVTDESGQPVADVSVVALHDAQRRTTQTDAAGHFTFADLKPEGVWAYSANDPRYGWDWDRGRGALVPMKPEELPVKILLYKARTLKGTVVDEHGKPVAGVRVVLVNQQLSGRSERISGHISDDFLVAQTDRDGHFVMDRLCPGTADFVLEHLDFAHTFIRAIQADSGTATLTIQKGLTARGRVTHDGKPVAGIKVYAGIAEAHRLMVDSGGTTDTDGWFSLPRIRSLAGERLGGLSASVSVKDGAWYSDNYQVYQTTEHELPTLNIEARRVVKGQAPDPHAVDIGKADVSPSNEAKRAGPNGQVRLHLPGMSDARAMVLVASLEATETPLQANRNVGSGEAAFDLSAGKYVFSVIGTMDPAWAARPPKVVELAAGQKLDLTMEPGPAQLKGVVRSGTKPVGSGYIHWNVTPRIPRAIFGGGAKVQPDGSYVLTGLAEGRYRVNYQAWNSMINEFIVDIGKGTTVFDINLPASRIEGTLVGRKPEPPRSPPIGRIFVRPHGVIPTSSANEYGGFVDATPDGHFTIEHLPPARYTIDGYGLVTEARVDRDDSVVHATLRPPEKPGEIAGVISGIPATATGNWRSVQVTAFPKEGLGYDFSSWSYSTSCDANHNSYRLRELPLGTYGVFVSGIGIGPEAQTPIVWLPDVEVREGMSCELPVKIAEGRRVSLTVHDGMSLDPAAPLCRTWRLLMPSGDWLDRTVILGSGMEGDFMLPFGEYTIEADYGDHGTVQRRFTVAPGAGVQKIAIAPASEKPATTQAAAIATLPNGVSIELVGIAPSAPPTDPVAAPPANTWFSPAGLPITAPYTSLAANFRQLEPAATQGITDFLKQIRSRPNAREFAFVLRGLDHETQPDYALSLPGSREPLLSSAYPAVYRYDGDGKDWWTYTSLIHAFYRDNPAGDRVNIRVALASGPSTASGTAPVDRASVLTVDGSPILVGQTIEANGHARFNIEYDPAVHTVRIVAVSRSGREYPNASNAGATMGPANDPEHPGFERDILDLSEPSLKDIDHLVICTRPMCGAEFRNVPLRAGLPNALEIAAGFVAQPAASVQGSK